MAQPRHSDNVKPSSVLARAADPESINSSTSGNVATASRVSVPPAAPGETAQLTVVRFKSALQSCTDSQTESALEAFVEECMEKNDSGPLVEAIAGLLLDETTTTDGSQSPSKVRNIFFLNPSPSSWFAFMHSIGVSLESLNTVQLFSIFLRDLNFV